MNKIIDGDDKFPSTRYQGSKRRLLPWIHGFLKELDFNSALDLFGGTGSVSYLMKKMGKKVAYNDILKFNHIIGLALIENSKTKISNKDLDFLLKKHTEIKYPNFIKSTFKDIYFTDVENEFLDMMITNINLLRNRYPSKNIIKYKQSMAYYALFQSCLIKRPFNLFHRKNLYLRLNEVDRRFGNKSTWEKSFEDCFRKFVNEINSYIFDNGQINISLNEDAMNFGKNEYDLVYIDPPYIPSNTKKDVNNYHFNYHFLEGIANYDTWKKNLDYSRINLPLIQHRYNWKYDNGNIEGFEKIIKFFKDSIILISYKDPGIPKIRDISNIIKRYKKKVTIYKKPYFYALNKNNGHYNEILILGK